MIQNLTVLPIHWTASTGRPFVLRAIEYCLKKPDVKYKTLIEGGELFPEKTSFVHAI
jgi:hypothetical protein